MTDSNPASAATGCPVHHGYEPFDMKDPFPAYAELRNEEPVMFDERTNLWVVTRYDDVKAVFEDWETFSSENAQKPVRERGPEAKRIMEEGGFTAYSGLPARVPPEHTRIRKVVQRAFTPRRYKAMEPYIRANVAALIADMLARPERDGDIVRDVAYDLPTITILTLFGLFDEQTAKERIAQFKSWSEARAMMTWGDLDDEAQVPYAHKLVEYWQESQALVAKAHAEHGDNMLGDLVRAQKWRPDHRPGDRVGRLQPPVCGSRYHHHLDQQLRPRPAGAPGPVGRRRRGSVQHPRGHRRSAALQRLDRRLAPQGVEDAVVGGSHPRRSGACS